jgi:hypothetical protein
MKPPMIRASLLLAALLAAPGLACADVYVIAGAAVELPAEEIRDVYIGDRQMAGSIKLNPIDNSSAQAEFLARVVKLDASKYDSLWTKKSFRDGLNPPPVKASDAEVIATVKANPNAVGYLSAPPPAGVKLIQKF